MVCIGIVLVTTERLCTDYTPTSTPKKQNVASTPTHTPHHT